MKTTWRKLIKEKAGEDQIVHCTLSDGELDAEFDSGFGGHEGKPFTAWGQQRVYFPVVYDGAEWVSSVPRNPCNEPTEHVGGE